MQPAAPLDQPPTDADPPTPSLCGRCRNVLGSVSDRRERLGVCCSLRLLITLYTVCSVGMKHENEIKTSMQICTGP